MSFRTPSSFLRALLPLMCHSHYFIRLLDPLPAMDLTGASIGSWRQLPMQT
jgi:hypothetical protein